MVFATQHLETGGIESHLQEFCLNLTSKGIKIYLVVLNSEMNESTTNKFRATCTEVYTAKYGRSKWRLLWLIKVGILLSLKSKFRCLYTNGQGDSVLLFAKLLWRKNKWVHHHHTSGDLADQLNWSKSYITALKKADTIIACSTSNALDMSISLGRKIDTVPCFSRQIAEKPIRLPGKLRLGYYGRLIPEKGIDTICKMSNDPDFSMVEFHLWGEGEAYPAAYFAQFPNLTYHGTFSGSPGLIKVIHFLDAFLLISTHSEGLPICLLEAMGAGLPWVATNKGGIKDIVSDEYATRLLPDNCSYPTIKRVLLDLVNDLDQGLISNRSQIELYKKRFSKDSLIVEWKNILMVQK